MSGGDDMDDLKTQMAAFRPQTLTTAAEAHAAFKAAEALKGRLFARWLELAEQGQARERAHMMERLREAGM